MIGNRPNIVTVLLSHPVVLALKICVNAIGSRIAAKSRTTKMLITASLIAMLEVPPYTRNIIQRLVRFKLT